jgi:hypothetical protein
MTISTSNWKPSFDILVSRNHTRAMNRLAGFRPGKLPSDNDTYNDTYIHINQDTNDLLQNVAERCFNSAKCRSIRLMLQMESVISPFEFLSNSIRYPSMYI